MNSIQLSCLVLLSCRAAFGQSCPQIYRRFSEDHTYCRRSECKVIKSGVTEQDKEIILKIHNEFRNKIALGRETTPQQQPPAANMVQMEWDDELARIAQAHANQCKFEHDTGSQRQVENFNVGQNLVISTNTRMIDWRRTDMWYTAEVKYFYPQYRQPYVYNKAYGHFTQVIWAETWKVGCGLALYYDDIEKMDEILYTCNYGPVGNLAGGTLYVKGRPCSQCPKNTQCSNEYKGLCKSMTPDGPQKDLSISSDDFLLYCDFSTNEQSECKDVQITGSKPFETRKIYSGEYKTVVLNGGESITIKLGKSQDAKGICPFIYGSFGPNKAGDARRSAVSISFSAPGVIFGHPMKIEYGNSDFWPIGIHMKYNQEMESTIKLEAYPGAAPQYFNIKAFGIGKGKCPRF